MSNTELERIARTETDIRNIKEDIKGIKDNHLPSLYKKLDVINGKLIAVLTTLVGALIVGIVNIMVK